MFQTITIYSNAQLIEIMITTVQGPRRFIIHSVSGGRFCCCECVTLYKAKAGKCVFLGVNGDTCPPLRYTSFFSHHDIIIHLREGVTIITASGAEGELK
jgi:hypothetical protein